ncbi:Ferrichrome outer membrane transporter/phage receptor [wastewater metagenome]|uniref:Ferrichrome outer membrane transporter/phage receptor n=2 Tax=unclassified sequences TaxID=12908 RepID=A0A5B8RG99_9ZZZZ|nr:TonB-dependent siderophore receptor [Arhodomonas sp. KWT]QEA05875.1 ferrichrome outer membrane transporter/phage receptor [uncultured organism]
MDRETNASRRRTRRNHRLNGLLMGCVTLVVASAGAHAQEASETEGEVYRLSPILVDSAVQPDDDANSIVAHELWVGGKVATSVLDTPASVSVITEKEIEERNAETVEEVLNYTPGIITDYYGGDDRNDYFLVRGFQASTYRDGMTLGSMRGVREEPYAFERVEVLKGANSTLFGPSDPGGSVNYVSKTPKFERFGEGYVQGGSFDHREAGFDLGDTLNETSTLAFRLTGKVKDSELEYDHSRDDEKFVMGSLTWEPSIDTSLTVVADYLKRESTPNSGGYPLDREYDRSRFFGEPGFNYHDVERGTVSAMFEHDFGGGLSVRANARYSDLTDDSGYVYLYDFAGRTGDVLSRYYFGGDSSAEEVIGNTMLQYDASVGPVDSSTLAGVEYRDASSDSNSFYGLASSIDVSDPVYSGGPSSTSPYREEDTDYEAKSLFLQQNLSFYDRVIVTGGVRHDWLDLESSGQESGAAFDDSDDFSESSFRGALTYKVTDEISSYVSYVESVAPPQVGVEPERGEQYELGVKYRPSGINAMFTASVFDLTKKDITVAVVQDNGAIERELIGESRVRGFEIEGKAELTENLSLLGGYSYLDTEVIESGPVRGEDVEGNEFASVPNHLASIRARYVVPVSGLRGDLSLGAGARFVGSYYFNQQNSNGQSDSTVLFDASAGYDVTENVDLRVDVSNLLDEQHVVGSGTANYYNPGRTIMASLRYNW